MQRTNFITRLVSFLLFGAMLAYLGFYVLRSMSNDIRTAPAVYVEIEDSVPVTGIIVRNEQLVASNEEYISLTAQNGQALASGEELAVAYSGEAALERAGRIRDLELQQQYILSALAGGQTDVEIAKRDSAVKNAVRALTSSVARHELNNLTAASVTLASLVMERHDIYTTTVDLNLVSEELNNLRQYAAMDTKSIAAPMSGLFFASVDGFEYLKPESLLKVSTEELRAIMEEPQLPPASVVGKIVDELDWYYAAIVPFEAAREIEKAGRATLDFGRYCSAPVTARVQSMRYFMDEECAIVFRCTSSTAEMLYARNVQAEILFGSTRGLRVPRDAVYEEQVEEKNTETSATELVTKQFIYTVTGLQAEKKYINIIWESGDYYLAEIDPSNATGLREGNDIILTNDEIYDGMLLG